MALFSTKPKKTTKKSATKQASSAKTLENSKLELALKAPWMSEKALIGTERGVYVFAIPAGTTKTDVAQAVERIYKVVPVKVNVAHLPGKTKNLRIRRGKGTRARRHKAYVYLKKGETIQF